MQSNAILAARMNPLKGGASDRNSLWTGRSHVQRLEVKPRHLYRMDTTQKLTDIVNMKFRGVRYEKRFGVATRPGLERSPPSGRCTVL